MLLKPEDPGTRLEHPNSIPERPPFHPSMSRPHHSLSPDPNLFYSNDYQNEFVRDLKSELLARRSCLDFDSVKISQS